MQQSLKVSRCVGRGGTQDFGKPPTARAAAAGHGQHIVIWQIHREDPAQDSGKDPQGADSERERD